MTGNKGLKISLVLRLILFLTTAFLLTLAEITKPKAVSCWREEIFFKIKNCEWIGFALLATSLKSDSLTSLFPLGNIIFKQSTSYDPLFSGV